MLISVMLCGDLLFGTGFQHRNRANNLYIPFENVLLTSELALVPERVCACRGLDLLTVIFGPPP